MQTDFQIRVDALLHSHVDVWLDTEVDPFALGARFDPLQQRHGAQACRRLMEELESHLAQYPAEPRQQTAWRDVAYARLDDFTSECLSYTQDERDLLFHPRYQQVTCDFVEQARKFDSSVEVDDLLQALRNVWIMNSVQLMLGQEVRLTRSVFAYSMLYPCTDNVLDDPRKSNIEKLRFNDWIEARIQGQPASLEYPHLNLLFDLIETEHPRGNAASVFQGILAIQHAQRKALSQQRGHVSSSDLLELTVGKGGASVLAHGYLVDPNIADIQANFLFGFGVFLQLLDDLQDIRTDLDANHLTLFSRSVMAGQKIDDALWRLLRFMKRQLANMECFRSPHCNLLQQTIWRNCLLLVFVAIAHQEEYCSGFAVRELERHSPLAFRDVQQLSGILSKRLKRARRHLARRHRVPSIWTVLGPASSHLWPLMASTDR